MEKEELEEKGQKEGEQAVKNVKYMLEKNKLSDVQLLYKDKFDLEKQNVCYSLLAPIRVLIPIYDKVLVPINPLPSQDKFEEYGCSVDELLEWRNKGWVETVLSSSPCKYTGLDYLDDLIEISPSMSVRSMAYHIILAGSHRYIEMYKKGEKIFTGRLNAPSIIADDYSKKKGSEVWKGIVIHSYLSLSAFGVNDVIKVVEGLAAENKIKKASLLAYASSNFLTSPFLQGLKKTTIYSSKDRRLADLVYGRRYEQIGKSELPFITPSLLADIYTNLGLTISGNLDTDEIKTIRSNSEDFIKAVKNLDEVIDKTVKEKFGGEKLDKNEEEEIKVKREELRYRWEYDVKPAFENIEKRREVINKIMMTGSIIAPLGVLSALQPIAAIPATLAAIAAKDKIKEITDPAAEYLSLWWDRNPIHIGFYKVKKEIEKLKR